MYIEIIHSYSHIIIFYINDIQIWLQIHFYNKLIWDLLIEFQQYKR